MNTPPGGGSGSVRLTADIADGARVAPGQDITLRLTWDPKVWSGRDLDMALDCVRVKGVLDPDLTAEERPTANDGVFEYRLHVPDNIRPDCDIRIQGFVAGMAADGGPEQVGSNERYFMSGPPEPPTPPATKAPTPPPVTKPPAPPTTPTTAVSVPPRVPAGIPPAVGGGRAGVGSGTGAEVAPERESRELPRTGPAMTRLGLAASGLTLTLGGLSVIGGAGRKTRRRTAA